MFVTYRIKLKKYLNRFHCSKKGMVKNAKETESLKRSCTRILSTFFYRLCVQQSKAKENQKRF